MFRQSPPTAGRLVWGPYQVEEVLRGDAKRGVGSGIDRAGHRVGLRWCADESARQEAWCAEREFLCLSEVADKGVPRPVDVLRQDGASCVVWEWIEGTSLINASDRVGSTAGALIGESLLRILRRAHARGWVHGDIKP